MKKYDVIKRKLPQPFKIAVDGLAASGKGTLSEKLAEYFNIRYLDTGKIYRTLALELSNQKIDLNDLGKIISIAQSVDIIDFPKSELLYSLNVGEIASKIAVIPEVRSALIDLQRNFAQQGSGAVLDGRDIGSVICPDAHYKLFVTARLGIRTQRRFAQLNDNNNITYENILAELRSRDLRDMNRTVAPLVMPKDSTHLDTSDVTIEHAFGIILKNIDSKMRY